MPTVYRIEFSEDAGQQKIDGSLAGAVTFDGGKSGEVTAGSYSALLACDEIKPLPHPLEMSALRAHGETYLSASLKGILLQVERRICLQCGNVFDAPRIAFSRAAGCMPALLLSVVTFVFLRFARGVATASSLATSFMGLIVIVLLFELGGALYIRARFSARQKRIRQLGCPACGSKNWASVSGIAGKRKQIGNQGKWVQVSIAGKS